MSSNSAKTSAKTQTENQDPTFTSSTSSEPIGYGTYKGSCHCSAITYTALLDPTLSGKCNCRSCVKWGKRGFHLRPSDLTLLTPSSMDDDTVFSYYQYGRHTVKHHFCKTCGTNMWAIGRRYYHDQVLLGLNCNTLDEVDFSGEEFRTARRYIDGRGDRWMKPTTTPAEGGLW